MNPVIYPCEIFTNIQSGFEQFRFSNNKEGIDMAMGTSLHRIAGAAIVGLGLLLVPVVGHAQVASCPMANFTPDEKFTSSFMAEKCKWTLKGGTSYFPLRPG